MSSGVRHPRVAAVEQARALIELAREATEHWTVVGSLRRGAADVGDVEHVVIGRACTPTAPPVTADLFGGSVVDEEASGVAGGRGNALLDRLDALVAAGTIVKALKSDGKPRWGERYRAVCLPGSTLQQEIFIADATNLGATLAIRTGPQPFSVMLQTLLGEHGYRNIDGYVRRIHRRPCPAGGYEEVAGDIVPVPTEADYLRLAGLERDIAPAQREAVAEHFWRARRKGPWPQD